MSLQLVTLFNALRLINNKVQKSLYLQNKIPELNDSTIYGWRCVSYRGSKLGRRKYEIRSSGNVREDKRKGTVESRSLRKKDTRMSEKPMGYGAIRCN